MKRISLLPLSLLLVCMACGAEAPFMSSDATDTQRSGLGTPQWRATGNALTARSGGKAVQLASGLVLVAGGNGSSSTPVSSAELYDPTTGTWASTGSMTAARSSHTVTRLANGRVLAASGYGGGGAGVYLASAELYDPNTGLWTATATNPSARSDGKDVLLTSGKVLITGGSVMGTVGPTASTDIYDPNSGNWSVGGMLAARYRHTATVLPSGKVLVTGGSSRLSTLKTTELYDPTANTWTSAAQMNLARHSHTATVLPSGKVLVAGGSGTLTCELYDPATNTWASTGSLSTSYSSQTAALLPSGKVLVFGNSNLGNASAELYDPATGTWSTTATPLAARTFPAAVPLLSGQVLVIGGNADTTLTTAELYDPTTGAWTATGSLNNARTGFTATRLASGQVLVAGGRADGGIYLTSAELYDPTTGTWSATGNLTTGRMLHSAILLNDGRVLVTGGYYLVFLSLYRLASTEMYNPATGTWSSAGNLATSRSSFTLHLLNSGVPLAVGGVSGPASFIAQYSVATAERFGTAVGAWSSGGTMPTPRYSHASAVLTSGKVMASGGVWKIGGATQSSMQAGVELYDPTTNGWTATAGMLATRSGHTLTQLSTGDVLALGCTLSSWPEAELYTP